MTIQETKLPGVLIVECEVHRDDRGAITTPWAQGALEAHGLDAVLAQCNLVQNHRRGTLRGLHYQVDPMAETKLVCAIRGAIYDVAVDLRPDSPTFRQWTALELTEDRRRLLYLPHGIAHGYETLTDRAEVLYFTSARYSAAHQRGVRWDDPAFGIEWPMPPVVLHPRDASYPDFTGAAVAPQVR
jgi:dTDP-4-dehydrorhamnose 3,5-epimerase